jgi:epoxide hydrolase
VVDHSPSITGGHVMAAGGADDLVPFTAAIPEAELDDLRERLARTRWPEAEPVDDWSQGIPLEYLREVCEYWRTGYDWRGFEKRLNRYDQRIATIDGLDIHLLHVRSPEPGARPLIVTHGWPGSVAEHLDVIDALADPAAHGGDPADAFHVVVPSLPGYGFSGKPGRAGWGVGRTADAWVELMRRLGYPRFLAQGGDWGSFVTTAVAARHPDRLAGMHLNLAICDPQRLTALGEPTAQEQRQLAGFEHYLAWENGYSQQQSTRPQTLGYGLVDSPAGQCGWILEKFKAWTDCDGHPENVISRDRLLDNISLYWFTATGASSARMYWESFREILGDFSPVTVPTAYSAFPKDLFTASERWARTRYPDLRYYSEPAAGGHFASFEQPALFVEEVRAGLRGMA